MKKLTGMILTVLLFLAGCTKQTSYQSISMAQAQEAFANAPDAVIVDVRTAEEYESGHIPNAINIPNESITDEPEELPDKEQTIYIYCRSGNRSKQAAGKLSQMGYSSIIECGGINDWTGDIVTKEQSGEVVSADALNGTWTDESGKYTLTITDGNHVLFTRDTTKLINKDFTLLKNEEGVVVDGVAGEMLNADCNNYNILHKVTWNTEDNTIEIEMTYLEESVNLVLQK